MTYPISITFQDLEPSQALVEDIQRHAERLQHFAPQIAECRVSVSRGTARHRKGNPFLVRARASLPGGQFEAGCSDGPDASHADPYVAVRDTFDALCRQLQDFQRIRRGEVKAHGDRFQPSA